MKTFPVNAPQSTRQYLNARRQRELVLLRPVFLLFFVGIVVAVLQGNALYLSLSVAIAFAGIIFCHLALPRPHCLNCRCNLSRLYAPESIAIKFRFCPYCGYALDAIPTNHNDA